MKEYIAIVERCGEEGESWVSFVPIDNNKESIDHLKDLCDIHSDLMGECDSTLEIGKIYSEEQVDFLVNCGREFDLHGYGETFAKKDIVFNFNEIKKIKSENSFMISFYKNGLFKRFVK